MWRQWLLCWSASWGWRSCNDAGSRRRRQSMEMRKTLWIKATIQMTRENNSNGSVICSLCVCLGALNTRYHGIAKALQFRAVLVACCSVTHMHVKLQIYLFLWIFFWILKTMYEFWGQKKILKTSQKSYFSHGPISLCRINWNDIIMPTIHTYTYLV